MAYNDQVSMELLLRAYHVESLACERRFGPIPLTFEEWLDVVWEADCCEEMVRRPLMCRARNLARNIGWDRLKQQAHATGV